VGLLALPVARSLSRSVTRIDGSPGKSNRPRADGVEDPCRDPLDGIGPGGSDLEPGVPDGFAGQGAGGTQRFTPTRNDHGEIDG